MPTSVDLVVLGAGPAGLAAAWRAARRGMSVTVVDRAKHVGGMAASLDVAGVRVDLGSHRLHPATPPGVLADVRRLLGPDLQLRPRNGRLRIGGCWVGFPLRAVELVRALPPAILVRAAADAVSRPLRSSEPDSYAGALRRGLGPTLYGLLYAPYARKLWGLDGEAIDAEQARKRVSADTPAKIAKRILLRRGDGQGRQFYYPRRGFGQIVEALGDAATASGATIRLGTQVDRITVTAEGISVGASGAEELAAGHLFTTVPLPALGRLCTPGPPPGVVDAAHRLRFRAMVLAYLVHEGARPWTPYDAHYLPDLTTPITRISEPANYRVSADDPVDRTVLCCEIPCSVGDDIWRATDDDLVAIVVDTLARHGLPPLRLGGLHVTRLPHVYPIYARGYADDLQALDTWASTMPRVTTFGRLGLFVHDNTHHAMAMAYDAVDALHSGHRGEPREGYRGEPREGYRGEPRGGYRDDEAWNAARARFDRHVVED